MAKRVGSRKPEAWRYIHHHPMGRVHSMVLIEEWMEEVMTPIELTLEDERKERVYREHLTNMAFGPPYSIPSQSEPSE